MSPSTLDLILALLILLFVVQGFFQGLVHMVGAFFGLIIGVAVASRYQLLAGSWIGAHTGWNVNITTIVAFFLIIFLITRIAGWVLYGFEHLSGLLKLPLVGLTNRILGSALGFIEGTLVVGLTLTLVATYPFPQFNGVIKTSNIAVSLMHAAQILLPLLPKQLRELYKA